MTHSETIDMRERIIEMATGLFVAQGYDGISMREIADACGMSKAGLYYHFKDKEDLFLAILSENLAELSAILDEIEAQRGAVPDQFAQFVRAVFTRLPLDHRAIIRLAGQEIVKVRPELRVDFDRRYHEQFIGRLTALYARGVQEGALRDIDPILGVWSLLGLMYPFLNPGQQGPAGEAGPLVVFIISIYLDGVAKHG